MWVAGIPQSGLWHHISVSLLVVFLSLFVEQAPSVLALLACYGLSGREGEEGWTCPLAWLLSGWAGLAA